MCILSGAIFNIEITLLKALPGKVRRKAIEIKIFRKSKISFPKSKGMSRVKYTPHSQGS